MILSISLIILSTLPILFSSLLAYQTMRAGFSIKGTTSISPSFIFWTAKAIAVACFILLPFSATFETFFSSMPWLLQCEVPRSQKVLSLVFLLFGNILLLSGYWTMSIFTRIGIPKGKHPLYTSGVYTVSRNPMYTSFLFFFTACFLLIPSLLLAALFAYSIIIHHRIIKAEETYLLHTHKDTYSSYLKKVARYL